MRNIVILGMHRSGTSMVAGALSAGGVYVGDDQDLLVTLADRAMYQAKSQGGGVCFAKVA